MLLIFRCHGCRKVAALTCAHAHIHTHIHTRALSIYKHNSHKREVLTHPQTHIGVTSVAVDDHTPTLQLTPTYI